MPAEFDAGHVYHLFVVRTLARDAFQARLRASGIETLIHYPIGIPRQAALASEVPQECPEADRAADEVCSLPLYPSLSEEAVDYVARVVQATDR